ncbi:beta-ketoacyl-ACP synthase III [Atopomonas sediminilitoris]|uniref:beta-ketoacyl-ACP synthase III n=1 Tax=Atopomonas sediminilitoris TaxID=2919919 RepID=UPI001F4E48F0|nr:beta-ketoacyl-ACP synthase III [Atopomonas sediminilitoris]
MHQVVISGTGLYTPPHSISNEELVIAFNTYVEQFNADNAAAIAAGEVTALAPSSAEFIEKASGIKSRFVMNKEGILDPKRMRPLLPERSNDELCILAQMGVDASRDALARAGRTPADVDGVIVACSNLQRAYPAISIEVQAALGIEGFAYDMNVACSSATFGLQAAINSVQLGQARSVLVVSPEICTSHLNFCDRDSHFIFGDAATAILVERADCATSEQQFDVVGSRLKTSFSNNIRNNFGFLNRCSDTGVGAADKLFVQQGRKVFKDVCPMAADLISGHLAEHHLAASDVKRFWLHQANLSMNQLIARKVLGRDPEAAEAPVILDEYANTSSAGSIIAFHKNHQDLAAGSLGVICSFGAGYSIGSVIVRKR